MKRNRSLSLLLLCSTVLLASCAHQDLHAPVEAKTSADATTNNKAASVVAGPGYRTVKAGDTLYRIALEAGQPYQNIVQWNHLSNPNDLKVGQVLRIAPPGNDNAALNNGVAAVEPVRVDNTVKVTPIEQPSVGPKTDAKNYDSPVGNKQPYSEQKLAQMQSKSGSDTSPVAPVTPPAVTTETNNTPSETKSEWIWPAKGKVTSTYTVANKGVDIAGTMGQTVVAASSGKVMYAGSGIRGYGNLIIIKHNNNLLSAYAHNSKILVKEGQSVKQGEKIAEMGNSDSSSVKLHFEIRQQGKPVDPTPYLPHQ